MWVRCWFYSLMIDENVLDDDLYCLIFLALLEISQCLFAPKINKDDVAYLDFLITKHHQNFHILYSDISVISRYISSCIHLN